MKLKRNKNEFSVDSIWFAEMNDNIPNHTSTVDTINESAEPLLGSIYLEYHIIFTNFFNQFWQDGVLHSITALEHFVWCSLLYTALCLVAYRLLFQKWAQYYRNPVQFPSCQRVLIVTAHPDDECMFFGPTILSLTKRPDCHVYLLCLSNGKDFKHQCFI